MSYVDQETGKVRKFEGNPYHPGSRGRNCAKGPATINQIEDPERILYPQKKGLGKRGEGKWERVSWESVLDDISSRIRSALEEGKTRGRIPCRTSWCRGVHGSNPSVMGGDGIKSYQYLFCRAIWLCIWDGVDRTSPDFANADFILLLVLI
ncbi:MAG: hypothetical protein CM1200mP30_22710 [Pseudomonadota bacterium]|nr:MAG: hypothetical protein CM1200mP30_22710 [Pseudomonadota bacterium]